MFLTRDETWTPLCTINVPRTGDYKVTCSSRAISRYVIGDPGGLVTLGGWLIMAIFLPTLGIGISAVIILVTAYRRRRPRKRLLDERYSSGGGRPARPGFGSRVGRW
ncbi:hypothetical protein AB0940_25140 [Streptomyces sp. NPDC006656]|uniref:hypothetical protein n=1 Tax=Streptomyces sp. NPDC006656 TaxID=3156899 RepID=UPI0034532E51